MDIQRMRELAGLAVATDFGTIKKTLINEGHIKEALDAAEQELIDKAEADLKKQEADEKAAKEAKKAEKEKKEAEEKKKSEAPVKKPTGGAFGGMVDALAGQNHKVAARGRGRVETDRTAEFRQWVQSNPKATRKDAMAFGAKLGMKATHINTKFYQFRKRVDEFWVVANKDSAFILAENSVAGAPIWVDYDDVETFSARIFDNEDAALNEAKSLNGFGHNVAILKFE